MTNTQTSYVGHEVVDEQREHIGKVTDILYDAEEADVEWLVVKPGLLAGERYVPVQGSYRSDDGVVVIPFDRRWVKAGPKVGGEHSLTSSERTEVAAHYDLAPG